eukprot:gene5050-907_t
MGGIPTDRTYPGYSTGLTELANSPGTYPTSPPPRGTWPHTNIPHASHLPTVWLPDCAKNPDAVHWPVISPPVCASPMEAGAAVRMKAVARLRCRLGLLFALPMAADCLQPVLSPAVLVNPLPANYGGLCHTHSGRYQPKKAQGNLSKVRRTARCPHDPQRLPPCPCLCLLATVLLGSLYCDVGPWPRAVRTSTPQIRSHTFRQAAWASQLLSQVSGHHMLAHSAPQSVAPPGQPAIPDPNLVAPPSSLGGLLCTDPLAKPPNIGPSSPPARLLFTVHQTPPLLADPSSPQWSPRAAPVPVAAPTLMRAQSPPPSRYAYPLPGALSPSLLDQRSLSGLSAGTVSPLPPPKNPRLSRTYSSRSGSPILHCALSNLSNLSAAGLPDRVMSPLPSTLEFDEDPFFRNNSPEPSFLQDHLERSTSPEPPSLGCHSIPRTVRPSHTSLLVHNVSTSAGEPDAPPVMGLPDAEQTLLCPGPRAMSATPVPPACRRWSPPAPLTISTHVAPTQSLMTGKDAGSSFTKSSHVGCLVMCCRCYLLCCPALACYLLCCPALAPSFA